MKNKFLLGLVFNILSSVAVAQNSVPNKVEGLELPPKVTLNDDIKTTTIEAKSKGLVKWLVISSDKIKYTIDEQNNKITLNLPAQGDIKILAISLVEGKNTEFAATSIHVKPQEIKKETKTEKPKVIMFFDYSNLTNEQLKIINNQYTNLYTTYKCYDIGSPLLTNEKYMGLTNKGNIKSLMIVESTDGKILWSGPVPANEKETMEIIKSTLN
jgi:hypothetical protein